MSQYQPPLSLRYCPWSTNQKMKGQDPRQSAPKCWSVLHWFPHSWPAPDNGLTPSSSNSPWEPPRVNFLCWGWNIVSLDFAGLWLIAHHEESSLDFEIFRFLEFNTPFWLNHEKFEWINELLAQCAIYKWVCTRFISTVNNNLKLFTNVQGLGCLNDI